MSLWGRLFAVGYDTFMAGQEKAVLRARRQSLLARASGRVLEIGSGTGANLPFYGPLVSELVMTEPEGPMARKLERRIEPSPLPARLVRAPAESLPVDDGTFDFVVSTLVLCTVEDPAAALREIERILKPDGELLFLEHVRSDEPRLARWQDRLETPWRWFGHGCRCNRPTLETIETAGFSVTHVQHDEMKALPIVRPLIVGAARRGAAAAGLDERAAGA